MKDFYVYILCNRPYSTLYTGVTSNLPKRIYEHRNNVADGFTDDYNVHRLVWYERHESAESAILREKKLKKWNKKWKLALVEKMNPLWEDLYGKILE